MSPDVLVIGGGPAGAGAARLLASWGHRVKLTTRPPGASRLAVSLPPSCEKLFAALGVAGAIERAGFIRSTGNTVWWGSDLQRTERFADHGRGWQVELDAFSQVLLAEAERAGVDIERRLPTADPRSPIPDPRPSAHFILDCSGRAGVVARSHHVRHYDDGPRTIALAATWRNDRGWAVEDQTHTLVESYDGGWAWSVPTTAVHRHIAVMVDPERSELMRGVTSDQVYLAELGRTRAFSRLTDGAIVEAGPWGWDASTYHATQYAGENWLLVGDAGSFIDPLSSSGVKKALASGWLAAIAVHTALKRPERRADAFAFVDAREREIHRRFTRLSRRALGDAAAGHAHAFWMDRADDAFLSDDEDLDDVRREHERLRQAPRLHVVRGEGVRIEPRPLIDGAEIIMAPHLVTLALPAGIRFVHDTDVVALLDLAPEHSDVADLHAAYSRRAGPVPFPSFLTALSTMLARGWLVSQ